MFADLAKYAARTAAVVAVLGLIVGFFAVIIIPEPDYSLFSQAIGKAYALMVHWVPGFSALWRVFAGVFSVWVSLQAVRFSIYAASIVLRIFA